MTTPRGSYGGGYGSYYPSSASFPDTPIYDSLVAERGTPQIAPIRVPSPYPSYDTRLQLLRGRQSARAAGRPARAAGRPLGPVAVPAAAAAAGAERLPGRRATSSSPPPYVPQQAAAPRPGYAQRHTAGRRRLPRAAAAAVALRIRGRPPGAAAPDAAPAGARRPPGGAVPAPQPRAGGPPVAAGRRLLPGLTARRRAPDTMVAMTTPTVSALHVYPVKSMRATSTRSAVVEPWGLAGDRRWMLVDAVRSRPSPSVRSRAWRAWTPRSPRGAGCGCPRRGASRCDVAVPRPGAAGDGAAVLEQGGGAARGRPRGRLVQRVPRHARCGWCTWTSPRCGGR